MMKGIIKKKNLRERIIWRSIKWPLILLLCSLLFIFISFLNFSFFLKEWYLVVVISAKLANLFIITAFLLALYNILVYTSIFFIQKLSVSNPPIALILQSLRKSSKIIFILVWLNVLCSIAPPSKQFLLYANKIFTLSLILAISWIGIQILNTFEAFYEKKMLSLSADTRIQVTEIYTKMHLLKNIGFIFLGIITISAILMSFSNVRNMGFSLLASAGFLTAIIGFAGQKTLSAIFSGFWIILNGAIKIGDTLFIDNKWAIVEEITLTNVRLRMKDNHHLIIPISYFLENKVESLGRKGKSLITSIYFYVDFKLPISILRKELDEILDNSMYWDGNIKKILVNKLNESSVQMRIQVSTRDGEKISDFRAEIREKFFNILREKYAEFLPKTRQIGILDQEKKKE
ncbi:mechanosensitive ion channel family protein [Fluoribacter dumoffii]|uniref:Mechanosensitive ion channel n=1 Tax=Fluoribacter dumoffii TaxID=463 RepID=A0A377G947_9GAMM|nr:mechanosensitive ion channel domain-containing protein [Fluoribacter dumoffii]KTC90164.1 mechanosensitive ion channel MscS [Fluoribacter dumoffii NY 23]STO21283.1 Mechanosensitive ion channel [Fluoribacter dumoffii]